MPSVLTFTAFLLRGGGGGGAIKNFNLQTGGLLERVHILKSVYGICAHCVSECVCVCVCVQTPVCTLFCI